ncbi:family 16 glycoside hydrolase [Olivibacter sp. XZL3]|uniref:family 16 glycoside hydrolase n=1 Tax=Olivibacter sp. XZL3 TaxID=1735116 RepID=UPI00106575A0|nr:family 16 glycoside hydrolase [Olivibacter sp. XZL3]
MKTKSFTTLLCSIIGVLIASAQQNYWQFNPSEDRAQTFVYNRKATFTANEVHLDKRPGDGHLRFDSLSFSNGTIELDIKGKNAFQESFVGVAFHGVNDSTYDAVYFRPFNFQNPERKDHSVQYVAHDHYTWDKLRRDSPGKYEASLPENLDPNKWFHVRIVIEHPNIAVYVEDSAQPALKVEQLSSAKTGWLGLWVGNNSDGFFKNIKVSKK